MRKRVSKRARLMPLLAACAVGYLVGAWHLATVRQIARGSAADVVAERFPQEWNAPPAVTLAAVRMQADPGLFRPVPMIAPSPSQSSAEQSVLRTAATAVPEPSVVQTASRDVPPPAKVVELSRRPAPAVTAKAPAGSAHPPAPNHAGYILDDAQIASIKTRLHLTPDQERMWPAVEAALRNMAYRRTQQAAARNAQTAAVDPAAVEGLKSAAVPLLMSFSSEQKEEVRSLAHVMGLDQLATQF